MKTTSATTQRLFLASQSPRRKQLLEQAGYSFSILRADVDEDALMTRYLSAPAAERPAPHQLPALLALAKAEEAVHMHNLTPNDIVIAADTMVIVDDQPLNKPVDADDARRMLRLLSGRAHQVVTAYALASGPPDNTRLMCHDDTAVVYFRPLPEAWIDHYVRHCKPFDKAGAYGVQDFIGLRGVERIEGSFYTVMGLPVCLLAQHLTDWGLVETL